MKRLKILANEASQLSNELIQLLEAVKSRKEKPTPWRSLRRALIAISNERNISEISDKLDTFRNELVLRVPVSLKLSDDLQSARNDERFSLLQEAKRKTAETLLDNRSFFTTGVENVLQQNSDESQQARMRHEETIAAITTLRGGAETLSIPGGLRGDLFSDLKRLQEGILDFLSFRFMGVRREEVSSSYKETFEWIYTEHNSPRSEGQNLLS